MTFKAVHKALMNMANRCDTPVLARRYRDLATALLRIEGATDWMAANLRQSIARIIDEIGQIKRDGFYANPLSGPRNRTTA